MNCSSCKAPNLGPDDFYFVKKTQRYQTQCKTCIGIYRRVNKDKINASRRKYYAKKKEELSKYAREYYAANEEYREKRKQDFSSYYNKHKHKTVRDSAKAFRSTGQNQAPILEETFDIERYGQLPGLPKAGRSQQKSD